VSFDSLFKVWNRAGGEEKVCFAQNVKDENVPFFKGNA